MTTVPSDKLKVYLTVYHPLIQQIFSSLSYRSGTVQDNRDIAATEI